MILPKLGVGIVYDPGLEPLLEPGESCINVIEIEPQTFWTFQKNQQVPYNLPDYTLQHLQSFSQSKIIHSVGFGLGGTHQPNDSDASAISDIIDAFDAPWVSEHLSFTHVDSGQETFHTGFMLSPLQTIEGALTAAQTIRNFSANLPVPLAVETGVNYLQPRDGELTDGEFVALTVDKANCGILLDLHNIWTNEQNGRQKVSDFLADIPLERVWEIHLAGGFEFEGYWLDSHSGSVPKPVMDLAKDLIPVLPNLKAVIFEIFPSFVPLFGINAIRKQLEDINDIWARSQGEQQFIDYKNTLQSYHDEINNPGTTQLNPQLWEKTFGELVTNERSTEPLTEELEKDDGIALIRNLIWKFRAGSVVKTLNTLTQLILIYSGKKLLESLLDDYFNQTKPEAFASEEATGFINYLRDQELDIPYLLDILLYEEGSLQTVLEQKHQYVRFEYDPRILLQALAEGRIPDHIETGSYELKIPLDGRIGNTDIIGKEADTGILEDTNNFIT